MGGVTSDEYATLAVVFRHALMHSVKGGMAILVGFRHPVHPLHTTLNVFWIKYVLFQFFRLRRQQNPPHARHLEQEEPLFRIGKIVDQGQIRHHQFKRKRRRNDKKSLVPGKSLKGNV